MCRSELKGVSRDRISWKFLSFFFLKSVSTRDSVHNNGKSLASTVQGKFVSYTYYVGKISLLCSELKSVSGRGRGNRNVLSQNGRVGGLGVIIIQHGGGVVKGVRFRVTALEFGHVVSQSFQVHQNLHEGRSMLALRYWNAMHARE